MTTPTNDEPTRQPSRLRQSVCEELKNFGVLANLDTDPALLRGFLNDLYIYQLRRLRDQLLAGAFPKREYANRVLAIRRRYTLLSLPLSQWTETTNQPAEENTPPPLSPDAEESHSTVIGREADRGRFPA